MEKKFKICSKCKKKRLLQSSGYCNKCEATYKRKRYKNNSEIREIAKLASKVWHLKNNYNLTVKELNKKLVSQNYKCAICGKNIKDKPCVDHNHKTGQNRGLLCVYCNARLAHLEDIEFVTKAKIYLESYE